MRDAVFLDRDGTIIEDRGYLATVDGVVLLPGALDALVDLDRAGFLLVLATNQSGIGRGYFTRATVDAQNRRLADMLAARGLTFAAVQVCPHTPEDRCTCRKPKPDLLRQAAERLRVDLSRSFMVGDKPSDVAAGKAAACGTVIVGGAACATADYAARDLRDAAEWILGQRRKERTSA